MEKMDSFLSKKMLSDPNFIGEYMRDEVFVNPEKGSSSPPYKVKDDFSVVDLYSDLGMKLIVAMGWDDIFNEKEDFVSNFLQDQNVEMFSNGEVHVAWFWDSDGTLLFAMDKEKLAVINNDCKKDYGWRFVQWQ